MRSTKTTALAALAALWVGAAAFADVIITKNGNRYEGLVIRETEDEIVINDKGVAEVPIKKADIVEHIKDEKSTEPEDPSAKKDEPSKKDTPAKPPTKKTPVKKTTPKKTPPRKRR